MADARLAYVILAHHRPEQVARLVDRLATPTARFYVHLDANSPEAIGRRLVAALAGRPRVRLLPRHACTWGGFGVVRATLEGLRALATDGEPYDSVLCLSGQDYPLVAASRIEAFHAERPGRCFMDAARLPDPRWTGGGLGRVLEWHWHLRLPPRLRSRPLRVHLAVRRDFPPGLQPHYGLAYWSITAAAAEHVLAWAALEPRALGYFRHVAVPDEAVVQSVVCSGPLAGTVERDPLHHVEWPPGSSSPRTLTARDVPALAASGRLFARKFDAEADPAVLAAIDAKLLSAS